MPIGELIRRVSQDLHAIEEMLEQNALGDSGEMLDRLDPEKIREFKSTIDNMRHFLWSYLEIMARQQGTDPQTALAAFRLRRATEMLRVLEQPLRQHGGANTPEADSFIDQITRMATLAIEKHKDEEDGQSLSHGTASNAE